jgi:pectinesterase
MYASLKDVAQGSDSITVSKNNPGDYNRLQDAFNSISCNSENTIWILIKNGIYNEKVVLFPVRAKVIIIGENPDSTIISFNDYSGRVVGSDTLTTHNSFSFRILSDNVIVKNITIENTAGTLAQAVAVEVKSDRVSFQNCRFTGNQDTFYANSDGRIYLKGCYIEGTTDFIFGKSIVYFDSCVVCSKKDSYITAASTPEGSDFGFIFNNCKLKATFGISKVFLGRPWRSFARTVFINSYLGDHIVPEGWSNWASPEKEKTSFYAEYNSWGPGADKSGQRVSWSHKLDINDLKKYSLEKVFSKKASRINFETNWIP